MTLSLTRDSIQASLPPPTGTVTGDSSYPSGGYTPPTQFGDLGRISGILPIAANAAAANYQLKWNSSTGKLQVYRRALLPSIITEEAVVVASNVGRLANAPGYIIGVEVTAGGTTGAFTIIPTGKTPTTTQVAVTLTDGTLTFLSTDAVTAVRVTYIPMGIGPFIPANRVVDEVAVAASSTFNFALRAGLIQYVYNNTASSAARRPKILPVGEAPSTGEIAIDINNSTATSVTVNAAQDTNSFLVTYWKFSAIGAPYGWTDQADIAVTSNAIALTTVLKIPGIFVGAFGDVIIGETSGGSTNNQARLIGPSGSAAANVAVYDPSKNTLTFTSGDAYVTVESAYIVLNDQQQSGDSEVPAGANLTGAIWQVAVFGTP